MAEEPRQDERGVRQDSLLHKPWVGLALAFGVALAVVLAVVLIVYVPLGLRWYLSPTTNLPISQRKDLVQGLASVGQALAVLVAGVVGLGGLYFTWRNLNQTRQLTEQGQITERFTRAIDQLGATDDDGNPRLEIRLGGIYALERIDKESPRRAYHSTVMEVLTAYVRENAPWPPKSSKSSEEGFIEPPGEGSVPGSASYEDAEQDKSAEQDAHPTLGRPPTDIRALLDVLKRREEERVPKEYRIQHLDLRGTYLRRANLRRANLWGANLWKANLPGANLQKASLEDAILEGADLRGADLRGALITQAQLNETYGDEDTQLPPLLKPPAHWGVKTDEHSEEH